MSDNPEQPVLDAIDQLVEWQIQEGRRRGDGTAEQMRRYRPGSLRHLSQRERAEVLKINLYTRPCRIGCPDQQPHNVHLTDAGRRHYIDRFRDHP